MIVETDSLISHWFKQVYLQMQHVVDFDNCLWRLDDRKSTLPANAN